MGRAGRQSGPADVPAPGLLAFGEPLVQVPYDGSAEGVPHPGVRGDPGARRAGMQGAVEVIRRVRGVSVRRRHAGDLGAGGGVRGLDEVPLGAVEDDDASGVFGERQGEGHRVALVPVVLQRDGDAPGGQVEDLPVRPWSMTTAANAPSREACSRRVCTRSHQGSASAGTVTVVRATSVQRPESVSRCRIRPSSHSRTIPRSVGAMSLTVPACAGSAIVSTAPSTGSGASSPPRAWAMSGTLLGRRAGGAGRTRSGLVVPGEGGDPPAVLGADELDGLGPGPLEGLAVQGPGLAVLAEPRRDVADDLGPFGGLPLREIDQGAAGGQRRRRGSMNSSTV